MTEGTALSARECIALDCLRECLWARPVQVGTEVYNTVNRIDGGGSNLPAIGAAILGRLRKRGLVTKLQPEGLWRITPAGRRIVSGMGEAAQEARDRVLDDIGKLDDAYKERGDIFASAFLRSLLVLYGRYGDTTPIVPRPVQPE